MQPVYQKPKKYANAYTPLRTVLYDCSDLDGKEVRTIIKGAIVERFRQLCKEHGISYTQLARLAGVSPSTVYSMLEPERRDVSVATVKKLCDGLELSIIEFFDCDIFRDLPPEIE